MRDGAGIVALMAGSTDAGGLIAVRGGNGSSYWIGTVTARPLLCLALPGDLSDGRGWRRALLRRARIPDTVLRPGRPSRCTLPMTALRVTPPRRPAISLALCPTAHRLFSVSQRSSVHITHALNA